MLTMQLLGNVGRDPEFKNAQNGKEFCYFSVATSKKVKGEKVTTWVNVTVFNENTAKFIRSYVKKGTKIFLEGEPQVNTWESNGETKSGLAMIIGFNGKAELCGESQGGGSSSGGSHGGDYGTDSKYDDLDNDIPF